MEENNKKGVKLVDLDKVMRSQKSKLARNLPKFIINFLKRVIRQNEINSVIEKIGDKEGIDFMKATLDLHNIELKVLGENNMPDSGRFIFVSNHPLGAADFGVVLITINNKFKKIKVLANEILSNLKNLKGLILPVGVFNKTSDKDKEEIERVLQSEDIQLLTFPAGLVSTKEKGKVVDSEWHRSFIRNAIEHKREIIPLFVDAVNSRKFYFISRIRKIFRLKFRLELILLPSEFFKKKNKTIPVFVGKPISYKTFDDSKSHLEWAQEVKRMVYDLKKIKL